MKTSDESVAAAVGLLRKKGKEVWTSPWGESFFGRTIAVYYLNGRYFVTAGYEVDSDYRTPRAAVRRAQVLHRRWNKKENVQTWGTSRRDPKKPSANERLIRRCQAIRFLPSQALAKVIGKKRVTKQEAVKKIFDYIKTRKLQKGYMIRVDRRLKNLVKADKAPRYAIIEAVHKNLKP